MLAPSTTRSRWLLRFGMHWGICLVFSPLSAIFDLAGRVRCTLRRASTVRLLRVHTRCTSWHPLAQGGNINTGHMKFKDCMCDFNKSFRSYMRLLTTQSSNRQREKNLRHIALDFDTVLQEQSVSSAPQIVVSFPPLEEFDAPVYSPSLSLYYCLLFFFKKKIKSSEGFAFFLSHTHNGTGTETLLCHCGLHRPRW